MALEYNAERAFSACMRYKITASQKQSGTTVQSSARFGPTE